MKMPDQAAVDKDSPSIGDAAADCLWVKWLPFFFGFGE